MSKKTAKKLRGMTATPRVFVSMYLSAPFLGSRLYLADTFSNTFRYIGMPSGVGDVPRKPQHHSQTLRSLHMVGVTLFDALLLETVILVQTDCHGVFCQNVQGNSRESPLLTFPNHAFQQNLPDPLTEPRCATRCPPAAQYRRPCRSIRPRKYCPRETGSPSA